MLTAAQLAFLPALLTGAVGAYAAAAVLALVRSRLARGVLGAGVLTHFAWLVLRGLAVGFFPLTNKTESFSAAGFAMAVVALASWAPQRTFVVPQLALALASTVAAALFPQELHQPSPLLRTAWYPLHVPLSFFGLAAWSAAGAAGLAWARTKDKAWLLRTDHLALQGFGLWSAAMICGGVWGVVAWGAYFMWDPKIVWSTILWFHYAAFVHVRLTPSLRDRAWLRPALAWLGIAWVLVAYVGTSFFFGKSSHAF